MPIVTVKNVGNIGLLSDIHAHETPVEAWNAGANIKFDGVQAIKFLGHSSVFGTPSIDPYWLLPWSTPPQYYWFFANGTAIYRTTGIVELDVTRSVGGAYNGGAYPLWSGGILGGAPFCNNNALVDYPQEYDTGTNKFKDMTNWPQGAGGDPDWFAEILRPFGNFIVAFGLLEDSTKFPTRVRWSHPADPGTLPASWVPVTTNDAGSVSLSETTYPVVDCLQLGNINIIYKEDSCHGMQFIGGNSIFRFWEMFAEVGILAPNCVQAFLRKHFVVTRHDVIVHDTQSFESVIDYKRRKRLFDNIDENYSSRTFVAKNLKENEMWICFVSSGSTTGFPDTALVWNWKSNTWGERDLPDVAFIKDGIIDTSGITTTFDGQESDLLTNGEFVSDITSWTTLVGTGGGAIAFDTGTMKFTQGGTQKWMHAYQGITTEVGKVYIVKATISAESVAANKELGISNSIPVADTQYTGGISHNALVLGENIFSFTATATTTYFALSDNSAAAATVNFDFARAKLRVPFDDDPKTFDAGTTSSTLPKLLMGVPGTSKTFFLVDDTNQFNGSNFRSFVERTGLPLAGQDHKGNLISDPSSVKFISAVYPRITGDAGATIDVYVGSQMEIDGAINWGSAKPFNIGVDDKIDCIVSTKLICLRFESTENKNFKLSGYALDMQIIGKF